MAQYKLRLLDENDVDVLVQDVAIRFGIEDYPRVGQIIGHWRVIAVVFYTDQELQLRVERLAG